jgi:aminoglycoside/choline kinase family phosphotransferase
MRGIAARLASLPRVLVHRDFQSQNILIHDDTAWLIDFQGMRPGLPHYDVASLLYDPYVELTGAERDLLLQSYKLAARRSGMEIAPGFDEIFYFCALQRLMQALGAYGFLGLQKGRPDFLAHIPAARRSLREVAARIDGLDEFVALLDLLP